MDNHRLNIVLDDNALRRLEDIQQEFYGLSKSAVIRMLLARFEGMDSPMRSVAARAVEADEPPVAEEPPPAPLQPQSVRLDVASAVRTEPKVFKQVRSPVFRPLGK